MSLANRAVLFILASYAMFAQPGLPACWLMQTPCAVHFHLPGMAEVPHSHDYLFDFVRANTAPALPQVVLSAGQWVAFLSLVAVWRAPAASAVFPSGWVPKAQYPPPRY